MTTELENERLVIVSLRTVAIVAIVAAAALSAVASITRTEADTTVIVAFIGIATAAVTALGVRRTRAAAVDTPTQPPPLPPELANAWRDAQGGQP